MTSTAVIDKYRECLSKNFPGHKLSNRGYCTAKFKFDVYPSAYANTYGSKVSRGEAPDLEGITKADVTKVNDPDSKLKRWWEEEWVDVCRPKLTGGYETCGRKDAKSGKYPYCRPMRRVSKESPKPVTELTQDDINTMCQLKDILPEGVDRKPTRIFIKDVDEYKSSLVSDEYKSPNYYNDTDIDNIDNILYILDKNVRGIFDTNDIKDLDRLLKKVIKYINKTGDENIKNLLIDTIKTIEIVSGRVPEYRKIINTFQI
jgi:hypothetical protein